MFKHSKYTGLLLLLTMLLLGCVRAAPATTAISPVEGTLPAVLFTDSSNQPVEPSATLSLTETPTQPAPTITETPEPSATLTNTPSATLQPTFTATSTATATARRSGIQEGHLRLFFIQLKTGGPVACGDSLVAVDSGIERIGDTGLDIRAVLRSLFSYRTKYAFGLYNPVYLSTFSVLNVETNTGGAPNIYLGGTYVPSGEKCDNLRVRAQIWTTIRQFGFNSLNIYLNGRPLGDWLANDK